MTVRRRYLTSSLALLVLALGYALVQGRPERPVLARPAGTTVASPRSTPARALPSAREILDRQTALALTPDQTRRLETLARDWSSESAALEADLQAATAEFSRFMDQAQTTRGASLADIRSRSADVSELGAFLRERRRAHGEAATRVLTDRQRATVLQGKPGTSGGGER